MKKFFLGLAGAALVAGSVAAVPAPAMAKHWHGHHRTCHVVWKKKVVWRNGHKHVIRYKVRRCW